ncbi:hypothetical protein SLA2020_051940 [Shorea laevis]
MNLDWWLIDEWRSSDMSLEFFDMVFGNSNDHYNAGNDAVVMGKDCVKTEAESKLSLKQDFVQTFELNGLENDGLGKVSSVGPMTCEDEELWGRKWIM